MAYNKSKYVEAAQKLLNQGKVPQAINEYQHILKYEPKDQVTLMTIGERSGPAIRKLAWSAMAACIAAISCSPPKTESK